MSKIHYLLIFLIITTVGVSFWLLVDDNSDPIVKKEVKATPSISKGSTLKNGYVQGYLEVPDLETGFKRCLNRGYSDIQKEVLATAQAYFSDRDFKTGQFAWNKIIATNDFGESEEFFLENTNEGLMLSRFEIENSKRGELMDKKPSSLEELKEIVRDLNISSNLYAQHFKDEEIEMTLILSNGIMKSLKIISPKKSVTCKP
ncbi:MAG: hypothetical protein ACJAT2_003229 [Bacteriovoracaceae bacterium]